MGCQSGTDACKVSDTCLSWDKCRSDACYCDGNKGPGEGGYYWQKGVWQGGGTYFWSSSVRSDDSYNAWIVAFDDGSVNDSHRYYGRYGGLTVRCVRGQMKPSP